MKKYIFPIIKILVSIVIILVIGSRNRFIYISNPVKSEVVNIICGLVGFFCILQIYLSVAGIISIREADSKALPENIASLNYREYHIDEVILLVENNDIIDLRIISNNKIFSIGASSDCKSGSSTFFDKLYYINSENFTSIDIFKSHLLSLVHDKMLKVISIDDLLIN